jgi:hypothetical protein
MPLLRLAGGTPLTRPSGEGRRRLDTGPARSGNLVCGVRRTLHVLRRSHRTRIGYSRGKPRFDRRCRQARCRRTCVRDRLPVEQADTHHRCEPGRHKRTGRFEHRRDRLSAGLQSGSCQPFDHECDGKCGRGEGERGNASPRRGHRKRPLSRRCRISTLLPNSTRTVCRRLR